MLAAIEEQIYTQSEYCLSRWHEYEPKIYGLAAASVQIAAGVGLLVASAGLGVPVGTALLSSGISSALYAIRTDSKDIALDSYLEAMAIGGATGLAAGGMSLATNGLIKQLGIEGIKKFATLVVCDAATGAVSSASGVFAKAAYRNDSAILEKELTKEIVIIGAVAGGLGSAVGQGARLGSSKLTQKFTENVLQQTEDVAVLAANSSMQITSKFTKVTTEAIIGGAAGAVGGATAKAACNVIKGEDTFKDIGQAAAIGGVIGASINAARAASDYEKFHEQLTQDVEVVKSQIQTMTKLKEDLASASGKFSEDLFENQAFSKLEKLMKTVPLTSDQLKTVIDDLNELGKDYAQKNAEYLVAQQAALQKKSQTDFETGRSAKSQTSKPTPQAQKVKVDTPAKDKPKENGGKITKNKTNNHSSSEGGPKTKRPAKHEPIDINAARKSFTLDHVDKLVSENRIGEARVLYRKLSFLEKLEHSIKTGNTELKSALTEHPESFKLEIDAAFDRRYGLNPRHENNSTLQTEQTAESPQDAIEKEHDLAKNIDTNPEQEAKNIVRRNYSGRGRGFFENDPGKTEGLEEALELADSAIEQHQDVNERANEALDRLIRSIDEANDEAIQQQATFR